LPNGTRIVGVARTSFTNEAWRDELAASTQKFIGKDFEPQRGKPSRQTCFIIRAISVSRGFHALAKTLDELEGREQATRLYYLATAPSLMPRRLRIWARPAWPMNRAACGE